MRPSSTSSRFITGIPALLGLRDGADEAEWRRIRAAQLLAGPKTAFFLLAANVVAALVVMALVEDVVPRWQITAWSTGLVGVALIVAFRRLATSLRGDRYASVRDIRNTWWEGLVLALAWSCVPILFCAHTPTGTTAGLGLTLAVLMTTAAFTMAPLALATLIFLGCLGSALVVQLILAGTPAAAGGILGFTLILMIACLSRARTLVIVHASEIALGERDQTVSLLLNEFEETDADWLWETDAAHHVIRASRRFALACDVDPAEMEGMPFLQIMAGASSDTGGGPAGLLALDGNLKARESFRKVRIPVRIAGEDRWWEITASPRYGDLGEFEGFRGVGSDVTEHLASVDKINRMARFDVLTGLPNRLMINETLVTTIADAEEPGDRYAFMMLDLDRFKAVNDTLGHPIGDRLLGSVSERLEALMNNTSLCGRLGGDEFAVVVRDASDIVSVEDLAQRIIESLSKPYEIDAHTLYIGASIGLAVGPRDGQTAETLVRSADLALYRAKDSGRGVFRTYKPELHALAEERRVLELALRTAVENGEMHLNYQPVVDADTGTLRGFEALLRWTNPVFGDIPPSKFISIAEDARLIAPIGAWVLRTACAEAAKWPSGIRVAVNVSAIQLQSLSFLTTVASALSNAGLPADRLELEVTETVFLHEGLGVTKLLDRLIGLGVKLSLDDFGTGYSSLGYLSRTRFSSIKIDRSFIQDAARGVREAVAVLRAVIALADSLAMDTTAEGVETETDHRMVRDFGCTRAQGYYFGRPMPVEEARALAQRGWKASAAA